MDTQEKKIETPKSLMIFSNGNVAAFNKNGEQICELQVSTFDLYFKFLESQGIDPAEIGTIETIINGRSVYLKPFKTEDGWWNYSTSEF